MNVLIAPDSFKDSLSALQVALCLKKGMEKILPDAEYVLVPMADGGEGTVEAMLTSVKGRIVKTSVHDPLMRRIDSFFGVTEEGNVAIIEMAAASGLELLRENERDPWITTSFGTGELIKAALNNHCTNIILGIGGSATNDAGAGMAMALGAKLNDDRNRPVSLGAGELNRIKTIDITEMDYRLLSTKVLVACDVTNPLTGSNGASKIYGPQKGADAAMVDKLDENLSLFAKRMKEQLGRDVEAMPGAGAAGGMGAGLMAFLGAKLLRGFDIVADITGLEQKIVLADVIITGEGKVDGQSQFGKTTAGVAQLAKKHKKPVILVAGTIGNGAELLYAHGIDAMFSIIDKPMTLDEALKTAPQLLEKMGERLGRLTLRMWREE